MSAVPGVAGSYRRLLGEPVLRGLAVADICARLPQGMVSITLLLIAAAHASMTTAGLVVAGYTVGQGVTGPLRGRLADRHGLARVCAVCAGGYAVAVLGLLAGSLARAPAGALIAAAAAAGLLVPPLSPGMRSLWSAHAAAALRQAAFALDAAVFDLAYIAGPVLASALATGIAPVAAAGVLLALTAAAAVIIGGPARRAAADGTDGTDVGRGQPALPARRSVLGALRAPALRRLLVTGALVSTALTAAEVALTAYVRHRHALWASGPLLAGISAGSIVGSLLLGARTPGAGTRRRLPRLLAWYALGLAALTCATVDAPLHGRRRSAGRAVPGPGPGYAVRPRVRQRAARQRHGGAGMAELGDERRRWRGRGRGRGARREADAGPGRGRRHRGGRGDRCGRRQRKIRCPGGRAGRNFTALASGGQPV